MLEKEKVKMKESGNNNVNQMLIMFQKGKKGGEKRVDKEMEERERVKNI